ncbi:MAG: hypothetical protein GX846_07230, partial [Deltaproteobacteria bacterium]|nr:hypothetical protein [Deltaproteobacteria bacterium]
MSEQTVKHLAWKKPVYIAMLVFILQISHVPSLFSAVNSAKDDDEAIINIFSPHDTELGRVSKKGVIYNRYNSTLG